MPAKQSESNVLNPKLFKIWILAFDICLEIRNQDLGFAMNKKQLFLVHCFYALGASFDSFAGRQFNPLDIWVFSNFTSWIEFAAKLNKPGGHLRSLAANGTGSWHDSLFSFIFYLSESMIH